MHLGAFKIETGTFPLPDNTFFQMNKLLLAPDFSNVSSTLLLALQQLYEQSFPLYERRDWYKLAEMTTISAMNVSIYHHDDALMGFCIWWNFKGFLYIEHLATHPNYRKRGVATRLLKDLLSFEQQVVLEIEPPVDATGANRLAFYRNAGLQTIAFSYEQPAYRKGDPALSMWLMARFELSPSAFKLITATIRAKVYEAFW